MAGMRFENSPRAGHRTQRGDGDAANACVLAEMWFSNTERVRDLVVVTVSEGVGTGIFANGQLVLGMNAMAGSSVTWRWTRTVLCAPAADEDAGKCMLCIARPIPTGAFAQLN